MNVLLFLWLILLTVAVPIAGMSYKYRQERLKLDREKLKQQTGISLGELKAALREVVEETNRPLLERLEALEHGRRRRGALDPYEGDPDRNDGVSVPRLHVR